MSGDAVREVPLGRGLGGMLVVVTGWEDHEVWTDGLDEARGRAVVGPVVRRDDHAELAPLCEELAARQRAAQEPSSPRGE